MEATTDNRLPLLLAELQRLLEEERRALLAGVPEQITAAAERKLAIGDLLEVVSAAPSAIAEHARSLARLERYNRENSVIVSALLRHMTRVLDELRRRDAHRSYQPDGTERDHPASHTLGAA
jgi:hypothetical protein